MVLAGIKTSAHILESKVLIVLAKVKESGQNLQSKA